MSFTNPINFPANAVQGDTYEFESRVYDFNQASGQPGYWQLTNPGTLGSAGGQEISDARTNDDGTNDRFIGPKGLADSSYLDSTSFSVEDSSQVTGPLWTLQKGEPLRIVRNLQGLFAGDPQPDNGLLITSGELGIDFFMHRASLSQYGGVKLSSEITSDSEVLGSTLSGTNQARRRGAESAYSDHGRRSGAREGYFRVKPHSQSTTGFQLTFGYQSTSTAAHNGTVYCDNNLSFNSDDGGIQAIFTQPHHNASGNFALITITAAQAFYFQYSSGGGCQGFWWLAMGTGVGMSKQDNPYQIVTPDGPIN